MKYLIEKAEYLIEAMPYFRAFQGERVVIKYGGAAMVDSSLKEYVIQDIALMHMLGVKVVIVHGGGPEISALSKKMGIVPKFVDGQRITDSETMDVAEMVLAGKLNGEIVSKLNQAGAKAVGLSGKDGNLITAYKYKKVDKDGNPTIDMGFVGLVEKINSEIINVLDGNGFIPVISPIGIDKSGQTYNINADWVACEMAIALKARKLILLTDVPGICADPKDPATQISTLLQSEAEDLIERKIISGGMIPKVEACLKTLRSGVKQTHILDGRLPHSLLLELFTTKGIGTQIIQ